MYSLYRPSVKVVSAREPHVKNWAPNNGFDYGGRMMAAGLDRRRLQGIPFDSRTEARHALTAHCQA